MCRLPSRPGVMRRIGKPWAGRNGSPFWPYAMKPSSMISSVSGMLPINTGCVGALRQHPGRSAILPNEFYEKAQRNAGPLIGAHKAMSVLDRDIWVRLFPIFPAVTGAFDED